MMEEPTSGFSLDPIRVPHNAYSEALRRIAKVHRSRDYMVNPRGLLITGESGAGKTAVMNAYAEGHPREEYAGGTRVPVLAASMPPEPTARAIATTLLRALGDPLAGRVREGTDRSTRLYELLDACRTEIILIDELHNLLDSGYQASGVVWLKELINNSRRPVVLLGLPHCKAIRSHSKQLRKRFSSSFLLLPFSSVTEKAKLDFMRVLRTFDSATPLSIRTDFGADELGKRLLFASYGLVGYLVKLFDEAVDVAVKGGHRHLSMKCFHEAFLNEIWEDATEQRNPFSKKFDFKPLDGPEEPFEETEQGRHQ